MSRFLDILRAFREYSSRSCLEGQNFSYTYGELLAEVERWSCRLKAVPTPVGSVMGLRADYCLTAIGAFLALLAHGFVPALIPRDRSLTEYLAHSNASALLEIEPDGTHRYEPITPPSETAPLLKEVRDRSEAGFIIFTSGSTGLPKAALHSLDRFLLKFDRCGRSLRTLGFLLFDHIAGLDTLFYTLRNGGTLIVTYRRDPKAILQLIASHRVEVLPTSPSFLRLLCAGNESPSADLSSLKIITYGSEPMDAATLRHVNERFPRVRIIQKYGSTELGSPRTVSKSNDSLWLKFRADKSRVKVVDGVLWMRSEGTMLGYINAPSPVTQNGWHCTGDLVEVDGEWLRFVGRADEMIKVGGERVSPSEVERIIRELDFVKDAFVSGEPHPLMGWTLAAEVVVATEHVHISGVAASIRRHCHQRLGPHHAPMRVTLVPEGSLETLGYRLKVQRPRIASSTEHRQEHFSPRASVQNPRSPHAHAPDPEPIADEPQKT